MKSLLVCASLLLGLNAFAGQDKGNGGFLYSRTSLKLLESSKESLLSDMDNLIKNKNQKVYTSTKCSKPIDLLVLRESIENLTYDFEAENTVMAGTASRYYGISSGAQTLGWRRCNIGAD